MKPKQAHDVTCMKPKQAHDVTCMDCGKQERSVSQTYKRCKVCRRAAMKRAVQLAQATNRHCRWVAHAKALAEAEMSAIGFTVSPIDWDKLSIAAGQVQRLCRHTEWKLRPRYDSCIICRTQLEGHQQRYTGLCPCCVPANSRSA